MATSAQIEDWPGKTGVKMVTLSSPSIKVMKKITVTSLAKETWKHNSRCVYFPLEPPFTQWSTLEKVQRKTETWSWVLTRQVAVEISYFTHCQLVDNINANCMQMPAIHISAINCKIFRHQGTMAKKTRSSGAQRAEWPTGEKRSWALFQEILLVT